MFSGSFVLSSFLRLLSCFCACSGLGIRYPSRLSFSVTIAVILFLVSIGLLGDMALLGFEQGLLVFSR
jgi:hypothetical protein